MPHLLVGNGSQLHRKLSVIFVSLCCLINAGCYHVRVLAPHPDPATEYKHKTVNTLAWGLVKEDKTADDCTGSNALDEVRVTSNLGYSVLTVATLGFWQPTKVEWRCSKPHEQPDTIHKRNPPTPPSPSTQNKGQNPDGGKQ